MTLCEPHKVITKYCNEDQIKEVAKRTGYNEGSVRILERYKNYYTLWILIDYKSEFWSWP